MAIKTKFIRGSILLTTLFYISLIALVVYGVYDLAMGNYRLSQRNEYLARAKALADSEMEYVYFRMVSAMMSGTPANGVPAALSDICDYSTTEGASVTPTTARSPFCQEDQGTRENWTVKRSITYDFNASGNIPDSSGSAVEKFGNYYYFSVKVEVLSSSAPVGGGIDVKEGRRMDNSVTSVFQYNVFAQGDLEFAPGGNVTINGDIAANGSIYMGASKSGSGTLTINDHVMYLSGSTFNTTALANGTQINAPVFGTSQAAQVSTMKQAENLVGGLNATDVAADYGVTTSADYNGLFGRITADPNSDPTNYNLQLNSATNNVYRSAIVPPPNVEGAEVVAHGGNISPDYPGISSAATLAGVADDPNVADLRAYNKAGLIITVHADNPNNPTVTQVVNGVSSDVSSTYAGATAGIITQTTMYDEREASDVSITQIDVGKLKTALSAHYSNFNGMLYVYLANSGTNTTYSTSTPAGVRLINGAATPNNTTATGFSVATNGGLYVEGNYNTITSDGSTSLVNSDGSIKTDTQLTTAGVKVNPAMLMADQVTVLSSNWADATTPTDISTRVAPSGSTTVGAGILTGNIAENSDGSYVYSGGGHNLVRFLEDWSTNNSTVNFYGSIGRLFESTQFTHAFVQPNALDANGQYVYHIPGFRSYTFNDNLVKSPPPFSPTITQFDRGSFFDW